MRAIKGVPKTGYTPGGAPHPGAYTGPNWWGVGHVEVGADLGPGIGPGTMLLVNFDRRHVAAGGQFLVDIGGWPELLRFRRFPRGLCARIGGRWAAVSGGDVRDMTVIGRLVKMQLGVVAQNDNSATTLNREAK